MVVEAAHKILPSITYTLVLNHAVGWVHWKATKFIRTLARKFGNAGPIFYLSRTWPNTYAKLFPDICHGFAVGFLVVVNYDSLNPNPLENLTKLVGHNRVDFRWIYVL